MSDFKKLGHEGVAMGKSGRAPAGTSGKPAGPTNEASVSKEIIDTLSGTHRIMERVLTLIRMHLDRLEPATDTTGLRFLKNALKYMHNYPGLIHHPAEEGLFTQLESCAPGDGESCKRLTAQHQEFLQQESELLQQIHNAELGDGKAYRQIKQTGITYCREHADHIYCEEAEVFPLAVRWLPVARWQKLVDQVMQIADPLAEQNVFIRYDRLYDRLMAEGGPN